VVKWLRVSFLVQLLGIPKHNHDASWVELPRERSLWLLAYVAAQLEWVSRQELLELFWPEVEEHTARNNLRQLLHRVRKFEWAAGLETEAEGVRWQATDVSQFRHALSKSRWVEAVQLYQGPFLSGVRIYELPELENWLESEREDLQTAWQGAALNYASELERTQSYTLALEVLEGVLEADPFAEAAVQAYLRIAAHARESQRARNIYDSFGLRLSEEMGLEPDPSTKALLAALVEPVPVLEESPRPRHNLPPRLTPFLGREQELAVIKQQIETPACRLLTLVGPGGIGKTRLGLQAAEAQLGAFSDGVYLVELASVAAVTNLVGAIANTIGLKLNTSDEPKQQLLNDLRPKEILLLLDNMEHLLEGASLLQDILTEAPSVKLLVTSRERLNLQSEWVLPLTGLSYPSNSTLAGARDSSAVKLFVERASRVQPGFALSSETVPLIVRICHLTQGWPLALELAATWLSTLSLPEIADEIAQNLDFLESEERDRPQRHGSLRGVFEQSWQRLSEEEQRVLASLSVFRGGFERQAAKEIAEASPRVLLGLVNKSLLERSPSGRLGPLEVIRQYAFEKLNTNPAEASNAQQRHAQWYLALAETAEPYLKGAEQAQWLERLSLEHDNLRSALAWFLNHTQQQEALRLAVGLHWFWYVRGHAYEGRNWLETALTLTNNPIPAELEAKARDALAEKTKDFGDYDQAEQYQQQALELWQELGNVGRIAGALHTLGLIARERADYERAQNFFEGSLELNRELGDQYGIGTTLNDLGILQAYLGNVEESRHFFEESLAIKQAIADQQGVAYALGNIAVILGMMGDKEGSRKLEEESLALKRELGDQQGIAVSLANLAQQALEESDMDTSWSYLQEAFELFYALGQRWNIAYMLPMFAAHALNGQQPVRAATVIGATYGISEALGLAQPPGNAPFLQTQLESTQQRLTPEAYEKAFARGKAMKLEQVRTFISDPTNGN
jgi:predicted ATPase/DNA-binding SARP family transcriptional activator